MKIDHLVMNVDARYQNDETAIATIRQAGFPYEPKWGKGTSGFKASNIWIGREYFELIHLLKKDGGGWMPDWVKLFNEGHRGLVCLMLDVQDIQQAYDELTRKGVPLTKPEFLKFKWGFGLFTRTMPWLNSYVDFFHGVPFQIGFQQMKDQKSEDFMRQYMVPNAKDHGITGIQEIHIEGPFTKADFDLMALLFGGGETHGGQMTASLNDGLQSLTFSQSASFHVSVRVASTDDSTQTHHCKIENVDIDRA